MLRALRQYPLLVGTAEVLTAAIRFAVTLVALLLLSQLAKVAL